jgi:hypothetical protein
MTSDPGGSTKYGIDVHNEAGEIVRTLRFADALEIVPA